MTTGGWSIEWDAGRASVQALGGMLGPAELLLADGRRVQPFAIGDWASDETPDHAALPALVQRLRGEWQCVPFGIERRLALPATWSSRFAPFADGWPHGYGSNHEWRLVSRDAGQVALAIDYPGDHPVRRLHRKIRSVAGSAELRIDLTVEMRQTCELCLALHPVFRLPALARQAELIVEGATMGRTYPVVTHPTSKVRPDATFEALDAVPAAGGGTVDLARLPLEAPNEELLQIAASSGRVVLRNLAEGYAATLEYDAQLFPTIVLWIANCGLGDYPWNGRFRALGIEPARAAFDLGQGVSANPANPWQQAGVPTTIHVSAGGQLATSYAIRVSAR